MHDGGRTTLRVTGDDALGKARVFGRLVVALHLRFTGRSGEHVALVQAYAKEQGLWHEPHRPRRYSEHVDLDLATVVPSLAGPRRPQDRVNNVPGHRI